MAATSDTVSSPRFRPWANIVRGGESEVVSVAAMAAPASPTPQPPPPPIVVDFSESSSSVGKALSFDSSEAVMVLPESSESNVAKTKKPAWNKPSNGGGAVVEVSPVMGAVSWPALSEAAKASPKSSSSDSLKTLSDGSVAVAQAPVISSPPQKQLGNPNSSPNQPLPIRQKSMKRGGASGGSATNGGGGNGNTHVQTHAQTHVQTHTPPQPSQPAVEVNQSSSGNPGPGTLLPNSSPRDPHHRNHNGENGPRGSQVHIGNDHQHQHQTNNFRRNNNGPHQRRDGANHRRDQDRGNHHDWHHRNFNGHMQPRGVQRSFIRPPPPPPSVPFVNPGPVRPPFGNPMGFRDIAAPVYYVPAPPQESIRGVPIFHPAPFTMILPPPPGAPDPNLHFSVMKQIDYYFSPENLCKDTFLRKRMDDQGWVPVAVIAKFNRVKQLTGNIDLILDVVRNSTVVEVQGDKIRKRNDWMNWPLPPDDESPVYRPQPSGASHDMLVNRMQSVVLEGGIPNNGGVSVSSKLTHQNIHSQSSDGEGRAATLQ